MKFVGNFKTIGEGVCGNTQNTGGQESPKKSVTSEAAMLLFSGL
jgi:hypothetical protein